MSTDNRDDDDPLPLPSWSTLGWSYAVIALVIGVTVWLTAC